MPPVKSSTRRPKGKPESAIFSRTGSASWTTRKIGAIRRLASDTADDVRKKLPKIYSRELVDVIFEQPYCRIANLVDAKIAGRQAASRYLKALVSIGVLEERALGREKLFVNPKLMNLLTRDGRPTERGREAGQGLSATYVHWS